jgi:hypothetical protein
MDRRNTWILGAAIVLGFLVFGLSQLWAQRFPGDGRAGSEGMVGRYQVVRSSPEAILLLDTVTGELYSAGREDIRPTSARHRDREIGGADHRPKDRRDFKDKVSEPRFIDKGPKDGGDFKERVPEPRFIDKADFKRGDFKDKDDGPPERNRKDKN